MNTTRPKSEAPSLLEVLLAALPDAASAIARVFAEFESVLPHGVKHRRTSYEGTITLAELSKRHSVQAAAIQASIAEFHESHPYFGEAELVSNRFYQIAHSAWREQVGALTTRRPDVMRVACDCLSRPDDLVTSEVVQFALLLLLRRLYDLEYNEQSIELLQRSHANLRDRFEQQARRLRKNAFDRYEHYLVDVCTFQETMRLVLAGDNLFAYYNAFTRFPLGVDIVSKTRVLESDEELPQIKGHVPPFPQVMAASFGQPFCMPGFDEVVWGSFPTLSGTTGSSGGFITLVAGSPGSGKTSFCLSVASKMAELGSSVRYITTEEGSFGLILKQVSLGSRRALATSILPRSTNDMLREVDFRVVQGDEFDTLEDIADQIEQSLTENLPAPRSKTARGSFTLKLPFPRVVVIDSLTVLLHRAADSENRNTQAEPSDASLYERANARSQLDGISSAVVYRRQLARTLIRLRDLGVAVFLIGSDADTEDQGLAYLVDNVFKLGVHDSRAQEHSLRTISVEKTRFQSSNRGRHILHLSRHHGFSVSPSLHTVIRSTHEQEPLLPDPSRRSHVFTGEVHGQLPLLAEDELDTNRLTLISRSHTVVYGLGSGSKAKLALSLVFEPRLSARRMSDVALERSKKPAGYSEWLDECRVLVLSFLYPDDYYQRAVNSLFRQRLKRTPTQSLIDSTLNVISFYPGYIDPETVVSTVRRKIAVARLEGRPYTAVVVDGLHNVLLQFPLLEQEPLLWPALYRIFRELGLDVVSTYTIFALPGDDGAMARIVGGSESSSRAATALLHLLVSACDYSFSVKKSSELTSNERTGLSPRQLSETVRVKLESSPEVVDGDSSFFWDPSSFSVVPRGKRARR